MQAFEVLADPVRRRILELLGGGETASGGVVDVIQREFGISQPAVSQHLKVLRESGFATVRVAGSRRLYSVDDGPLRAVDAWLDQFRSSWVRARQERTASDSGPAEPFGALEALATEVARGKRARRADASHPESARPDELRDIS